MKTRKSDSGFIEVQHTADLSVKVWAPGLAALLQTSALALYALTETELDLSQPVELVCNLQAPDAESLLVAFLSELLYYGEVERVGFNRIDLEFHDAALHGSLEFQASLEIQASLAGGPILRQTRAVKAVTYHGLSVIQTENGLEATLVFDV